MSTAESLVCSSAGPSMAKKLHSGQGGDKNKEKMKRSHEQVTKELGQLQNHFEAQPGKPPLWIACAGIHGGKAENIERSYLTSILPPDFHLPEMDVPLRNTKQTLALAGLKGNKVVKGLDTFACSTTTNPVHKAPSHLMEGVPCQQEK